MDQHIFAECMLCYWDIRNCWYIPDGSLEAYQYTLVSKNTKQIHERFCTERMAHTARAYMDQSEYLQVVSVVLEMRNET